MARAVLVLLVGLMAHLTPPLFAPAIAKSLRAVVLSIGDGDSIRVRQGDRTLTVRLACIDAPEIAQTPYGVAARRYLQQRLQVGQEVTLQPKTIDRYGRTVAEVIGEININLVMVEDGQAFAYRRYLDACDAREYLEAEFRASRHRYGVWQVEGGITRPWDFRRGQRAAVIPEGTTPGGRRFHCRANASHGRAQQWLHPGSIERAGIGGGEACEDLP